LSLRRRTEQRHAGGSLPAVDDAEIDKLGIPKIGTTF
jgi:hypothetical protein